MTDLHPPPILEVRNLTKDFVAVRAVDNVTLSFAGGQVHGIVGENGAGKSTLVNVIAGLHQPTSGEVMHEGRCVAVTDPSHAMRLGIGMVHQELNLAEGLSVADNIFLGRERTRFGLLRRRHTHSAARELLRRIGCDVAPAAKLGALTIAQRQMVEIARSVGFGASVLIMDEPTAVLSGREVKRLFYLISRLRDEGVAVVYISHILSEVLTICDRITVMRDGRVVRTMDRADIGQGAQAERRLGSLMVGRPLEDHFPPKNPAGAETAMAVRGLSSGERVRDVSFEVAAGEILGFAGLVGAGRTEMAEAVVGLRQRTGGGIEVGGRRISPSHLRDAVSRGVAYLSEDRRGRGLVMGRSVVENTTLVSLKRYVRYGLIRKSRERAAAEDHAGRLSIRLGSVRDRIETLSGGNQQKVCLAKWLEVRPKVLLLDEPTRGIDIGAKEEIYHLIARLADGGMACVFISSELNELLGMCHRIAVMRAGRVATVLEGEAMTEEGVMFHAAGVKGGDAA